MASERDLELLDEYLTNRMKGSDKSDFELRLRQDPDLQSELNFHQHIADGLRKARIKELKDMLGKVPVASGFDYSNLIKWTGAGAIATGIGIGLYLYFQSPAEIATVQHEKLEAPAEKKVTPPAPATETESATSATDSEANQPALKKRPSEPAPEKAAGSTPVNDPKKVEVFDPTADAETDPSNSAPVVTPPGERTNTPSRSVVVDNDNRKYKFHYQLDGDNLTLYGDFEQNLYTIMEFKSEDTQTVIFMYYKNNYYLLNQSSGTVNRLVPVNDPSLLKRLREQREMN